MCRRVMYHALHQSGHLKECVVQDVAVPYPAATEFLEYIDESWGQHPLWLYPLYQRSQPPESPHNPLAEERNPNIPNILLIKEVWCPAASQNNLVSKPTLRHSYHQSTVIPTPSSRIGLSNRHDMLEANRGLERKLHALDVGQWLYATMYHIEEEGWRLFHGEAYDVLRTGYDVTYLPTMYERIEVGVEPGEKAMNESLKRWFIILFRYI